MIAKDHLLQIDGVIVAGSGAGLRDPHEPNEGHPDSRNDMPEVRRMTAREQDRLLHVLKSLGEQDPYHSDLAGLFERHLLAEEQRLPPSPIFDFKAIEIDGERLTLERDNQGTKDRRMWYWRFEGRFGGGDTMDSALFYAGVWKGRRDMHKQITQSLDDAMRGTPSNRGDDG